MLFSYVGGQRRIGDNKKCRRIAGDFDCHADAAVHCGAHRPMEHILSFTQSHWMSPLGKCLSRITPVAAMVNEFVETTQNTNKTQFLASDYRTFLLVKAKQLWDPKWTLYSAHQRNKHRLNLKWQSCSQEAQLLGVIFGWLRRPKLAKKL
jgi:hypothetical protein